MVDLVWRYPAFRREELHKVAATPGLWLEPRPDESHRHFAFGGGASQLKDFARCPSSWWATHVRGMIPRDTAKHFQVGTDAHSALETFLISGVEPSDPAIKRIVAPALEHWRPYVGKVLGVERSFVLDDLFPGFRVRGQIDLIISPGVVVDHKTTSDLKWAKSTFELERDLQAQLYSLVVAHWHPEVEEVRFSHSYMLTRGTPAHTMVDVRFTREQLMGPIKDRILGLLEAMQATATHQTLDGVTFDATRCNDYGGCTFRDLCAKHGRSAYSGLSGRLAKLAKPKEKEKMDTIKALLLAELQKHHANATPGDVEGISAEHLQELVKLAQLAPEVSLRDLLTYGSRDLNTVKAIVANLEALNKSVEAAPQPPKQETQEQPRRGRPTERMPDGTPVSKASKEACDAWIAAKGLPVPQGRGSLSFKRDMIKAIMKGIDPPVWPGRFDDPAPAEAPAPPLATPPQLDPAPVPSEAPAPLLATPPQLDPAPVPSEAETEVAATVAAHPEVTSHEEALNLNGEDKLSNPGSGFTLYVNCLPVVAEAIDAFTVARAEGWLDQPFHYLLKPYKEGTNELAARFVAHAKAGKLPPAVFIDTRGPSGPALLEALAPYAAEVVRGV